MSKIIDGRAVSTEIKTEIKNMVKAAVASGKRPPCLSVMIAGGDGASLVYVSSMEKSCIAAGIRPLVQKFPAEITEVEVLQHISALNEDGGVDGILVQLPLPKHINEEKVLLSINPEKDMDAFHPLNMGLLTLGLGKLLPCTPHGVVELLKRSGVEMSGKNCVVIGRSNIVGKPAALLLLQANMTVTVCHSKTANLAEVCRTADILVAAVGKPRFVTSDMIKDGAVVIDVGVHQLENGLCGDVDYDACYEKARKITPVPGGVGPMTIAMLLRNCMEAYNRLNH